MLGHAGDDVDLPPPPWRTRSAPRPQDGPPPHDEHAAPALRKLRGGGLSARDVRARRVDHVEPQAESADRTPGVTPWLRMMTVPPSMSSTEAATRAPRRSRSLRPSGCG